MGWIKDAKAQSIQKDAAAAWADDAQFFTPVLNFPTFKMGFSGAIKDWPPMMEAIESVGWKLHTWVVSTDKNDRPQAMPLFTRP